MLSKQHRLSGKQINFLLGRGKKLHGSHFVLVYFPQHTRIPYTQRSVTIPVKLDKRASMRNFLKRHAKLIFLELWASRQQSSRRQFFIFLNKKTLDEFKQLIATGDKTAILTYRKQACAEDFHLFLAAL
ncbi:MAG: ribonuclease P protein component [bacterium]|nr:ribonuclease P protein component [bacterium]